MVDQAFDGVHRGGFGSSHDVSLGEEEILKEKERPRSMLCANTPKKGSYGELEIR